MGMFWAKVKLTAPSMLGGRFCQVPLAWATESLRETIERGEPNLCAYERLAAVYDEYARGFCPDYVSFLRALGRKHRIEFQHVLDLACGAGTLTTRLAEAVPDVVGLDLSPSMLNQARKRCQAQTNVRLVHADFRDFLVGELFDAIVCASDSLNYLHELTELAAVFRCTARHLNPRGVFVFDAIDDRGFRHDSGRFIPIQIDDTTFCIVTRYDRKTRVEQSLAIFGSEVELHRRIPIEPEDVHLAARNSGLAVLDWFSVAGFGLLKYGGIRNFYVLQRPAS